jgi:DNA-binding transcriptional regulator WhiA
VDFIFYFERLVSLNDFKSIKINVSYKHKVKIHSSYSLVFLDRDEFLLKKFKVLVRYFEITRIKRQIYDGAHAGFLISENLIFIPLK